MTLNALAVSRQIVLLPTRLWSPYWVIWLRRYLYDQSFWLLSADVCVWACMHAYTTLHIAYPRIHRLMFDSKINLIVRWPYWLNNQLSEKLWLALVVDIGKKWECLMWCGFASRQVGLQCVYILRDLHLSYTWQTTTRNRLQSAPSMPASQSASHTNVIGLRQTCSFSEE